MLICYFIFEYFGKSWIYSESFFYLLSFIKMKLMKKIEIYVLLLKYDFCIKLILKSNFEKKWFVEIIIVILLYFRIIEVLFFYFYWLVL